MHVRNMTNSRGNIVKNQFIIQDGHKRVFQSYDSVIAIINNGNTCNPIITLDRDKWDYSVTTGRFRNIFLGEGIADTRKKIASGEYKLKQLN